MPWFFSGNSKQQSHVDVGVSGSGSEAAQHAPTDAKPVSEPVAKKGIPNFDASALERAAEAVTILARSKFAPEALQLAKEQEKNYLYENSVENKKVQYMIEQRRNEALRIDYEERRKSLEEKTKLDHALIEYKDRLARQMHEHQLGQQRSIQEETLLKQEESVARQEQMRRQTIEHELNVIERNRAKNLQLEMQAQAHIDRENRDINIEQIRLKAQERRQTILEGIRTAGVIIGDGAQAMLTNPMKVVTVIGSLSALALGIYTSKRATGIAARYIESRISTPSLVDETSRLSILDFFKHPVKTVTRLTAKPENALKDIVLDPKLEERLQKIALSTKEVRNKKGIYQNILMYGPPGTGKTMFAKKLAEHSGMDYAIVTGGKIAPLGLKAVPALQKLLSWSQTSRRGLLVFIDEADAFLRDRSKSELPEDMHSALNQFIHDISHESSKLMLALASNRPEQFDRAVHSRIDKSIKFELPGLMERERLLMQCFKKYVLEHPSRRFQVVDFDYEAAFKKMAQKTEGMSGREISHLGVSWQTAAHVTSDGVVTEQLILDCCDKFIEVHKIRMGWLSEQERADLQSATPTLPLA